MCLTNRVSKIHIGTDSIGSVARHINFREIRLAIEHAKSATHTIFSKVGVRIVEAYNILIPRGIKVDPYSTTGTQKVVLLQVQAQYQTSILGVTNTATDRTKLLLGYRIFNVDKVIISRDLLGVGFHRFEKSQTLKANPALLNG